MYIFYKYRRFITVMENVTVMDKELLGFLMFYFILVFYNGYDAVCIQKNYMTWKVSENCKYMPKLSRSVP